MSLLNRTTNKPVARNNAIKILEKMKAELYVLERRTSDACGSQVADHLYDAQCSITAAMQIITNQIIERKKGK